MNYDDSRGLMNTPPPDAPCLTCQTYTPRQAVVTPRGAVWQCKRCLTPAEEESYEFSPRRVPSGREEGVAAARVLQLLVVGLRHSQDGPLDPADLYEVLRPYFNAGWCVRDVIHGLNQTPAGTVHPDSGWRDRLPRKQLLYRVRRRLWEWRWADRDEDDDVMAGGWSEMRHAMRYAAQRQEEHGQARDAIWHEQVAAARQASNSPARRAARAVALGAAARSRQERAAAQTREQQAFARAAAEAAAENERRRRRLDDLAEKLSRHGQ